MGRRAGGRSMRGRASACHAPLVPPATRPQRPSFFSSPGSGRSLRPAQLRCSGPWRGGWVREEWGVGTCISARRGRRPVRPGLDALRPVAAVPAAPGPFPAARCSGLAMAQRRPQVWASAQQFEKRLVWIWRNRATSPSPRVLRCPPSHPQIFLCQIRGAGSI